MSQSIILIDSAKQHRQVIRQFIGRNYPDVQLIEQEPTSLDQVATSVNWANYDLLLIDNHLGNEDGLRWVERFKSSPDFPPVIFLSSSDINSTGANKEAEAGLLMGARGFLFKKQLDASAFSGYVSTALGRGEEVATQTMNQPLLDEIEPLADITPVSTPILKDTFHEMQQARAMLHGHDCWPFSVQDLQAGQAELAGYHIESYLGRRDGIYTFVGHSKTDERRYAIKLIERSLIDDDKVASQLKQRFERILSWHQPHLARWLDYQEVDGHLIAVQELVDGEQLSHRLNKTGVTRAQAIAYIRQLLQALSHLHAAGIKAGSFSPEDMVFTGHEDLMLTHFDMLAELVQAEQSVPTGSALNFTYNEALYLSPEVIQGRSVDHRSDLYIVGVILYRLLAGKPPFSADTTKTVLTDHVTSPIPLLQNEKDPLNGLISTLMAKTPGKRIQTANEVLQFLDQ